MWADARGPATANEGPRIFWRSRDFNKYELFIYFCEECNVSQP